MRPRAVLLQPVGRLPATNRLELAIGLRWRNREALSSFLRQLYDPTSPSFRHYLTPSQFTEAFGPTEREYRDVITSVKTSGLSVTGTHANRMLVDVAGTVADIESAFQVKLRVYARPRDARCFFAPDTEPSVDKAVRVMRISGLDNYSLPRARRQRPGPAAPPARRGGSGPSGYYFGSDYRTAYLPDVSLTGTGQAIGLVEFDGYYSSDITKYEKAASLPNVALALVLIDGFNGVPSGNSAGGGNEEVALDIEMAISVAPGLSQVLVYECSPTATTANANDLLNRMATDNMAKQLSCSWGFDVDTTSQQIFQEFAAQGQSFFLASGDAGAFGAFVDQPADDPFLTVVGGTRLTTDRSQRWVAETTWNGSGGGISSIYFIPDWQRGIDMSLNSGSTTMRNLPDVALIAEGVWIMADQGKSFPMNGTSISTALWAGFAALVNEQAALTSRPPVGFLNPALYTIGKGATYTNCFHDITTGNNTSSANPSRFFAAPGYDLCTGWGTPNGGKALINALLAPPVEPLRITPPLAFIAQGPVGGPFTVTTQAYTLTNLGTSSLNWSCSGTPSWLTVSPPSGSLGPAGSGGAVSVSLSPAATNLLLGAYSTTISFTNLNDGVVQDRQFTLLVGNGGFETGDFTDWHFSGDPTTAFADSIDATDLIGSSTFPGINDSLFVHSGIYGALLGQKSSLGFLSQTLPTAPGWHYLLSFWLDNPAPGTSNELTACWNGTTLLDQVNLGAFAWTNLHFAVSATGPSALLQFGFRNDSGAFGLDDISVQPLPPPMLGPLTQTNGSILLTWTSIPGLKYQVQYTDDLTRASWFNLGLPLVASQGTLTAADMLPPSRQRFYRIALL